MNILLPTDFSVNAETARAYALDIAQKTGGQLNVLHSYDLPTPDRSISTSLVDIMRENGEKNMKAFVNPALSGVQVRSDVLMGNPIRLTKELVEDRKIDIIVMGTKGASGLEEFLIGSNASAVIHAVDVPVLVIPPDAELKELKTIVLATDLDPKIKERPFVRLRKFAEIYGAKIDVLHIQQSEGIQEGSRERVKNILGELIYEYSVVKADDKEEAILNHCKEEGADVVCTIAKRYNFFEKLFRKSLTSKLAYHSSLPLLALHQED